MLCQLVVPSRKQTRDGGRWSHGLRPSRVCMCRCRWCRAARVQLAVVIEHERPLFLAV